MRTLWYDPVGRLTACIAASLLFLPWARSVAQKPMTVGVQDIAKVEEGFAHPPDDARVLMRWWWFGPAVVKPELQREILAMKQGGIGGFEIQPVYPMALDDKSKGFHNLPYLSDGFLDAVRFASTTARENGMRVDMTLASGWPYGGKYVPVDEAAARLRAAAVDVPPQASSIAIPALEGGERFIAAFAGRGSAKEYDPAALRQIQMKPTDGRMELPPSEDPQVVVFYIDGRTGQQVKRAAVDAEGFVLDHFSRQAVNDHLTTVGDRLMQAFGAHPPYSVFSDSLEVYGADWTDDLLAEFKRRRGYDLTPYLPVLMSGHTEVSDEVRHDWGLTLTELIDERYLTPINEWAKAHGTRFRSQTYGEPAVSLSSNRLVALPEGEGPQWNQFSYTRWATSASHLYGRPITSGETWTWLHSPAFSATPLDMKAEADRFFLEGVNQIVGHGWPYTPPGLPEPGWSFYAAAVFNDHNPWWIVMPDVTSYLQRVSYLLRQGEPSNDVALFLPNDDAYSEFKPGQVSLSAEMPKYITPALTQAILGAGYNFDYIDAEAIQRVGIHYPVLVLPHVQRLSEATVRAIAAYVAHGGKVIALGAAPDQAPGFLQHAQRTAVVLKLSRALFATGGAQVIASEAELGGALQQLLKPDVRLSADADAIGFLHRKLANADLYFVVNTSNHPVHAAAMFRASRQFASLWNPFSGKFSLLDPKSIDLDMAPYASRVVVFSNKPLTQQQGESVVNTRVLADLSHDWKVQFSPKGGQAPFEEKLSVLSSWTSNPKTRFFSGTALYEKRIRLNAAELARGPVLLDFGTGTPVEKDPKIAAGMRALLDPPIRDVAVVSINGKRVGSVWHPPYRLDITGSLHPGENLIQVEVANTAINLLAGREPADYRLLNARYGKRFSPQDMNHLQPLPSGLLGPVQLMEAKK